MKYSLCSGGRTNGGELLNIKLFSAESYISGTKRDRIDPLLAKRPQWPGLPNNPFATHSTGPKSNQLVPKTLFLTIISVIHSHNWFEWKWAKVSDISPVKTLSWNTRRSPWWGDHHWGGTTEALNIEPESHQLSSVSGFEILDEIPQSRVVMKHLPDGFRQPTPLPSLVPGPVCLSQVHSTLIPFVGSHKVGKRPFPAVVTPHLLCFRECRSFILTPLTPSLFQTSQERHVSSFSLGEATLKE